MALAAAANVIGLAGRIANLPLDAELKLPISPWFGIIYSAVWTLVFATLTLALFHRPWARAATFWAAPVLTLYALIGLVMLFAFARADYDRGRVVAELAVSLLVLASVWRYALLRGHPGARTGEGAA